MTPNRTMSSNASSSTIDDGLAAQALRFFFNKMAGHTPFEDQTEQERAVAAALRLLREDDVATLFIEYPLAGDGSFDVHVYPVLKHACSAGATWNAEPSPVPTWNAEPSPVPEFLMWCRQQPALVAEGGCAYDLSSHAGTSTEIPEPCLYAAFFTQDKSPVPQSFDAMGASQFTPAFHDILSKLQSDHGVYYTGVMYGRNPLVAHIGYKVNGASRPAYRNNPKLLFEHLEHIGFRGFDASCEAERFKHFASQGFSNDVQYAFDESGIIQDTLAFSYVPSLAPNKNRDSLRSGDIREALEYLQDEIGVVDDRWRALEQALGSWLVPYNIDKTIRLGVANISIGYVKIGWKLGIGANRAKVYISVQVAPI